ncbi:hypothetical protein [Nitrosomonas halophila]|nr:hypothetical protein [Nitrosomonas halophila]
MAGIIIQCDGFSKNGLREYIRIPDPVGDPDWHEPSPGSSDNNPRGNHNMVQAIKLFLAVLLSSMSFTVNALVLEQAPYFFDDENNVGGDGYLSVESAGAQVAEDFRFAEDVILTSISWWGSYDPFAPETESFAVRIIGDDGTGNPAPGFPPLYETIFTGLGEDSGFVDLFDETVFQYKVAGLNWSLQGGVDYYLSIFSNAGASDWYWLESQAGDNKNWYRENDTGPWSVDSPDALNMSFHLEAVRAASVPEPATWLLMLIPLIGLYRKTVTAM